MTTHKDGELVVFVTVPSGGEAERIGHQLVEKGLAACVNLVPQIASIFRWEGKIEHASEVLLMIKTRSSLFDDLMKAVKAMHSYSVPEVIALPIMKGSEDYLQWLRDATTPKGGKAG